MKLLLALLGTVLALSIGEIVLRTFFSEPRYYTWPPNLHRTFKPDTAALPGIAGDSRFIVNSEGMRGDEIPAETAHCILAIGGSTTECLYLDRDETWPHLLQDKLAGLDRGPVWVGNVGKSGLRTREHVVQMKFLLRQYPEIDSVVMLVGQNDFMSPLIAQEHYDPNFMKRPDAETLLIRRTFSEIDGYESKDGLALWYFFDKLLTRFTSNPTVHTGEILDDAGAAVEAWRRKRRDATILEQLPDLSPGLADYEQNLNWIIDYAEQYGVRLIFVTQPAMWRPDLSEEEKNLLQSGGKGRFRSETVNEYYSPAALERGLARFNAKLVSVARRRGVEYIDVTPWIPKDTSVFYDDVHFNESGAEKLAEVLFRSLRNRPPFKD